jgi:purine-nucleoside phosphorylase
LLSSIAAVEHLELTGIFAACNEANIPCGAILVVANYVGPEAHVQWQENHTLVSRSLIDTLKNNGIFNTL